MLSLIDKNSHIPAYDNPQLSLLQNYLEGGNAGGSISGNGGSMVVYGSENGESLETCSNSDTELQSLIYSGMFDGVTSTSLTTMAASSAQSGGGGGDGPKKSAKDNSGLFSASKP